ncbi:hypothetical protein BDR26DRAFT_1012734 [Obelidium mucronatum]|nr:hypothetical protein BDR26DRAFT_1012734 [Obelidium mucronatum]
MIPDLPPSQPALACDPRRRPQTAPAKERRWRRSLPSLQPQSAQRGDARLPPRPRPRTALPASAAVIQSPSPSPSPRPPRPATASAASPAPPRRPVSASVHSSRSAKLIDGEYCRRGAANLRSCIGPELDMAWIADKASQDGLYPLITRKLVPASTDFSKLLLDPLLISLQGIPSKESHSCVYRPLQSFDGMVKYETSNTKQYTFIIPRPEFLRTNPPPIPQDSRTTPVVTPNWTPNTAGYQQPIYPPSQPFFSPRSGSPTNSACPYGNSNNNNMEAYKYPQPCLTPTENLLHLSHLQNRHNMEYTQDQECFPIANGVLMETAPSFVVFRDWIQRQNKKARNVPWASILYMIRRIENFCSFNLVSWADISKEKLLSFLKRPIIQRVEVDDILFCLSNRDEVEAFIESPGHLFRCKGGAVAAANRLAEVIRTNVMRKRHLALIRALRAAERVVLWRKRVLKLRYWDRQLAARLEKEKPIANELIENLKSTWAENYENKKRVIIHLPSVSCHLSIRNQMANVPAKQLQQMGRFKDLLDPNVTIIYISYPMEDDIQNTFKYYMQQIFLDHRYEEDDSIMDRFHIIVPENHKFFPPTASLSSMTLASVNTIKKIKRIVFGGEAGRREETPAYIVPGVVGDSEVSLSVALGIPLLTKVEIAKSFAFNQVVQTEFISRCELAMPPGESKQCEDINDLTGMVLNLLIDNESIKRWMFKINHQPEQTGIMYWDANEISLKSIDSEATAKSKIEKSILQKGRLVNMDIRQRGPAAAPNKRKKDRRRSTLLGLPSSKRTTPTRGEIEIFLELFVKQGGVVQAAPPVHYEEELLLGTSDRAQQDFPSRFPSAHFLIKPDFSHELICTSDQICVTPYRFWGTLIPQQSCNSDELASASLEVLKGLKHHGYFGYVTIDFVTWEEHSSSQRHLWCIAVKPYLNDTLVYCMNYLAATATKIIQPGNPGSGNVMLDLNRSRKIVFKYLESNKYIDLPRVKKAARMAVFDGDQDLTERVGIYSPNFRHVGLAGLTSIGIEVLCLDSGLSMDFKFKRGVMALNSERLDSERMSLMFSEESCSTCIEQVLKAMPTIYRRLMTIESDELTNFTDVAYCLIPELRRARHREALFKRNSRIEDNEPEFYQVIWRPQIGKITGSHSLGTSSLGIEINIEDADSAHNLRQSSIDKSRGGSLMSRGGGSSSLMGSMMKSTAFSAFDVSKEEGFHVTNLSPLMNINSQSSMSVFMSGTDTVTLLTKEENQQLKKRLASNALEGILVQATDLPDYKTMGIDDFNPIHRLRVVANKTQQTKKPLPVILPDPKSIALLNTLIPSYSLWAKYEDYGEIQEYQKMMPERDGDPNRVPKGLPVEEYLRIMEEMGIAADKRAAAELERKRKAEEERRKEEERKKLIEDEERALAELAALIAKEKSEWLAAGKALTSKVQEEIESATRRYFFDQQEQEKERLRLLEEGENRDSKQNLRLKDFMGKYKRPTVGPSERIIKPGEGKRVSSSFARASVSTTRAGRRSSISTTVVTQGPLIQSITMRGIGEQLLGLRPAEKPKEGLELEF